MTDAFRAVDTLIAALQQLSVGDPRELGDGGARLHGLEAKLNYIAGGLVIFFVIGSRLAEDRHPCDVTVVSFVTSTKVGNHAVAFVIRSIVVARRGIQHEKTRMTRMRSLFNYRDEQSVGNFATGHTGSQLRQTAVVSLDRDFTGFAHELDFLRAFD